MQLWSRIPERLPVDLRGEFLDFLGTHPSISLARTAQRLYHRTAKLSEFRRRTRWTRNLRWEWGSRMRRVFLICLTWEYCVNEDPRGPRPQRGGARSYFYCLESMTWKMYCTSSDVWATTLRTWHEFATHHPLGDSDKYRNPWSIL
jgi:hypothetical protein